MIETAHAMRPTIALSDAKNDHRRGHLNFRARARASIKLGQQYTGLYIYIYICVCVCIMYVCMYICIYTMTITTIKMRNLLARIEASIVAAHHMPSGPVP